MREQPAQILNVMVGPTEVFVAAWCKPKQHDEHCRGYRYFQFLADCKQREANVREAARQIIARRNAMEAEISQSEAA